MSKSTLRRNPRRRGVSLRDYNLLAKRVSRGLTTWSQLEAEGLVLPPQPRGRPLKKLRPVA